MSGDFPGGNPRVPPPYEGIQVNFCKNVECGHFGRPASPRRTWYGKQPYDPRMVQKLLDLLRLFHNYCLKSKKDKMTPAMRLGLARAPIDLDEVIYFQR